MSMKFFTAKAPGREGQQDPQGLNRRNGGTEDSRNWFCLPPFLRSSCSILLSLASWRLGGEIARVL